MGAGGSPLLCQCIIAVMKVKRFLQKKNETRSENEIQSASSNMTSSENHWLFWVLTWVLVLKFEVLLLVTALTYKQPQNANSSFHVSCQALNCAWLENKKQ